MAIGIQPLLPAGALKFELVKGYLKTNDRYETSVVPGAYFERPEHFRVGLAGDVEMTHEGLIRLAAALHAWKG